MAQRSVETLVVDRRARQHELHLSTVEAGAPPKRVERHLPSGHVLGTEEALVDGALVREEIEHHWDRAGGNREVRSASFEAFGNLARRISSGRFGEGLEVCSQHAMCAINGGGRRHQGSYLNCRGIAGGIGGRPDKITVDRRRVVIQRVGEKAEGMLDPDGPRRLLCSAIPDGRQQRNTLLTVQRRPGS